MSNRILVFNYSKCDVISSAAVTEYYSNYPVGIAIKPYAGLTMTGEYALPEQVPDFLKMRDFVFFEPRDYSIFPTFVRFVNFKFFGPS